MTKGSDSREFFEIFKTPLKVEVDEKKEVKHITESTDVSSKQKTSHNGRQTSYQARRFKSRCFRMDQKYSSRGHRF